MRLIAWFLFISTLVLATWLLWGGKWETWFTLEGAVTWIESTGPWAWAAGIALLAADVILHRVRLTYEAVADGFTSQQVLDEILAKRVS